MCFFLKHYIFCFSIFIHKEDIFFCSNNFFFLSRFHTNYENCESPQTYIFGLYRYRFKIFFMLFFKHNVVLIIILLLLKFVVRHRLLSEIYRGIMYCFIDSAFRKNFKFCIFIIRIKKRAHFLLLL